MRQAIVSVEDKRFYEHNGVDLRGIGRAVWQDVRQQSIVQGGSTITQQFVKNAYMRNQRSIGRKIREAALAWQLEQRWSKDRILHRVPEHDLLRQRRLRDPAGGARVLQEEREARRSRSRHSSPGFPSDPTLYDPVAQPAERARSDGTTCSRMMLEQGKITRDADPRADKTPLPQSARTSGLRARRGLRRTSSTTSKDQLVAAATAPAACSEAGSR